KPKKTGKSAKQALEENKSWMPILWPLTKKGQKNQAPSYSLIELLQTSYDHTQDRLTEMMIIHYQPDMVVNIPRSSCATFEFYRAKEMIEAGKNAYHNSIKTNKQTSSSVPL